jgi:hypothetical protein
MNDGEVGVRGSSGSKGRRGDGGGWSRDDEAIGAGVRVGGMMVSPESVMPSDDLQFLYGVCLTWLDGSLAVVYDCV